MDQTNAIDAKSKLGDIVVAFGYATREAVDEAASRRQQEIDANRDPGLFGGVLTRGNVCTPEQVAFALDVQAKLRQTNRLSGNLVALDEKSLIGKILIVLGFAADDAVEAAFVWQKAERDAGRDPGFIGGILVTRGVCTAEQRDYGMKVQNALRRVS